MIIGINATYLASKRKTGVENYATLLIKALLSKDRENKYLLFSPKYIDKKILPDSGNWELFVSPFPRGWHRFRLPLSLLRHKVDIFFDPGYTVPPFLTIPTVVAIHDLAHKYYPEVYTPSQIKTLERSFRLAQKKSAGLIFSSQNTQDDFEKFYPGSKAAKKVIYLGYNDANFGIDKFNDILHLAEPYMLYVGRIESKKNIINLIRAYVKMRHKHLEIHHKLVLCGMPGVGYDEIVKEAEANQKYGQDIIFIGYVKDRDLPHIFASSDLFIYPSLYEGFGIPILEAFSAKVPIAASNASSIPEVAGDAAFYFDPKDTDDMSKVIATAITDKNARKNKTASGTARLKLFTWDNYCQDFLAFAGKVYDESRHSS